MMQEEGRSQQTEGGCPARAPEVRVDVLALNADELPQDPQARHRNLEVGVRLWNVSMRKVTNDGHATWARA